MRYFKSRGGHMSSLRTQRSIWSGLCELLHTELNMKDASVFCIVLSRLLWKNFSGISEIWGGGTFCQD